MHTKRIVRKKIIVRGGGLQDVIMEHTKNGIQYLKMQSINGVRRLVPFAFQSIARVANMGVDHLAHAVGVRNPNIIAGIKEVNGSAAQTMGDIVERNMVHKMGGRVAPNRNLVLREINHALRHH